MNGQRSIPAVVGCLVLGLVLHGAVAQDADDPAVQCVRGVEAVEQGQADAAVAILGSLFAERSDYVHPEHGAVAYWLGRAYAAVGQPEQAYETWEAGYRALLTRGLADVWLSDALVRAIYRRGDTARYPLGADAYLNLLAYLDTRPAGDLWGLLAEHLETLALILPESVVQATGVSHENLRSAAIQAEAGSYLVRWWRSQDTLPATRENERLQEHLVRVAYAAQHYTYNGDLDDRAAIYIRLGKPYHETAIAFNSTEFQNKVLKRVPTLTVFSFPQNAYWVYKQIDQTAQYLFVKKNGGAFRLGTPNDLIPETLQMGTGGTQRGVDKAEALVWTMHEMYRQLALYHPAFLSRYNDAADYAEQLDDMEFLGELDRRSEALNAQNRSAEATRNQGGNAEARAQARRLDLSVMPDVFTRNLIMTAAADDNMAAHDRAERVPRSYANLLGDAEPINMSIRVARFLNPEGSTRAEVYWSTSAQNLRPTAQRVSSPYYLTFSLVQKAADYQERAVQVEGHLIDADFLQDDTHLLAPQQAAAPGDTATMHLAMQWDLYATTQDADGQLMRQGAPFKANVYRADTLTALIRDEGVLEMSDLKPMLLDDDALATENLTEAAALYPFFGLANDTPLALYFEVYHLAYGADDRTHYDVAYEIKRRRPGSLVRLRRGQEDRIAARTDLSGSSRTAQELIALDLSAWEGTGEVEVTIRVTDTVSGQQVARSLFFELVEAGE